jgi:hypothetical protein
MEITQKHVAEENGVGLHYRTSDFKSLLYIRCSGRGIYTEVNARNEREFQSFPP